MLDSVDIVQRTSAYLDGSLVFVPENKDYEMVDVDRRSNPGLPLWGYEMPFLRRFICALWPAAVGCV